MGANHALQDYLGRLRSIELRLRGYLESYDGKRERIRGRSAHTTITGLNQVSANRRPDEGRLRNARGENPPQQRRRQRRHLGKVGRRRALVDHENRDLNVVLGVGSRTPGLALYLDQRGHDAKVGHSPCGKKALAAGDHEAHGDQSKRARHISPLMPSDGMIGSPSSGVCWLKS